MDEYDRRDKEICEHIRNKATEDGSYAIAWALMQVEAELHVIRIAIDELGERLSSDLDNIATDPDSHSGKRYLRVVAVTD